MRLIFGDDASIERRDEARLRAAGYELVERRRKVRHWDIERDETGQPVAMYWGGDREVVYKVKRRIAKGK